MKKIVTGLLAGIVLSSALPAWAGPYGYSDWGRRGPPARHHHHFGPGPVILGLTGLALGTALYAMTPRPVVVAPAVAVPPAPAPAPVWYYCESYQAYYPNVPTCPEAWRAVPGY